MTERCVRYILDQDGNAQPCPDLITWAEWIQEHEDLRRLARTSIPTASGKIVEVSTVFLGLDHRFGDEGPPVLWETMVFVDGEGREQERWRTKSEAETGHARWVEAMTQKEKLVMTDDSVNPKH